MDKPASTWALVPLKSPDRAKSRLAAVLSPAQRARLFLTLAERVVRALLKTPGIDHVAVVTASPALAALSRSLGALPLVQSADAGMCSALDFGLRELRLPDTDRVLMIAGDLPLISPAALTAFLAQAPHEHGVALVPDRKRAGTNVLLCAPPHVIAPGFGERSFERHLAAATAADIEARVLPIEELALDLDEREDVDYLAARDSVTAAELFEAGDPDVPQARHRAVAG